MGPRGPEIPVKTAVCSESGRVCFHWEEAAPGQRASGLRGAAGRRSCDRLGAPWVGPGPGWEGDSGSWRQGSISEREKPLRLFRLESEPWPPFSQVDTLKLHTHAHVHTHTCTHAHTHMRTRTHAHVHTCTCTRTHAHPHPHTHVHLHAHTGTWHTGSHARGHGQFSSLGGSSQASGPQKWGRGSPDDGASSSR